MQYREHLKKVAQLNRSREEAETCHQARSLIESWHEDLYTDFDQIYQSMSGKPVAASRNPTTDRHLDKSEMQSPMLSVATSEQTRADSCNTVQSYQIGPALVEETTLSDLEEEISSSLMASKEAARWQQRFPSNHHRADSLERIMKTPRSRQPLSDWPECALEWRPPSGATDNQDQAKL